MPSPHAWRSVHPLAKTADVTSKAQWGPSRAVKALHTGGKLLCIARPRRSELKIPTNDPLEPGIRRLIRPYGGGTKLTARPPTRGATSYLAKTLSHSRTSPLLRSSAYFFALPMAGLFCRPYSLLNSHETITLTRECEPHLFAGRNSVRLTARPNIGGSPFAGWVIWSGEQDDEPTLSLTESLVLTQQQAGRDDVVYAVAVFGIDPDLGFFGKEGGGGGSLDGAGGSEGSSGSQGGTGGGLPSDDAGSGGRGEDSGGTAGRGAGGANTGGQAGAAGGNDGGAGTLTCTGVTPNPAMAQIPVIITGTGFESNMTATCAVQRSSGQNGGYTVPLERVIVVSDSELQALPPLIRPKVPCVLRIHRQNAHATCPEILTIK